MGRSLPFGLGLRAHGRPFLATASPNADEGRSESIKGKKGRFRASAAPRTETEVALSSGDAALGRSGQVVRRRRERRELTYTREWAAECVSATTDNGHRRGPKDDEGQR